MYSHPPVNPRGRGPCSLLTNGEALSHELQAALGWATVGRPLRFEVSAHGAFDVDGTGQSAELLGGVRYTFGAARRTRSPGPASPSRRSRTRRRRGARRTGASSS